MDNMINFALKLAILGRMGDKAKMEWIETYSAEKVLVSRTIATTKAAPLEDPRSKGVGFV